MPWTSLWTQIPVKTLRMQAQGRRFETDHPLNGFSNQFKGFAAAIGRALRDNDRGLLVTIELDPESFRTTAERIREMDLQAFVHAVHSSSLDYTPPEKIELALFDSELPIRGKEFTHFLPAFASEAIILFHDSNTAHGVVRDTVNALTSEGLLEAILLPTPRGLALCRLRDRRLRS
ncbi:MAG: class I SAM-dependent methyltransferase [Candidatus Binataceae bacterium]